MKLNARGRNLKQQEFVCPFCKGCFTSNAHLKRHMRVHTGEKPYKCPHCDYATAQSSNVKIHVFCKHSHMYNCVKSVGNRASDGNNGGFYPPPQALDAGNEENFIIRSVESNYRKTQLFHCPYCFGKCFKKQDDLRRHIRTHTGEKPYKCPFCNYCASQNYNVRLHIARRHERLHPN
ncbi:hypothetical protein SK128_008418 [Halocaridina rubra]|uniref:C2H2-type domain-containing protein n=1 Tax=Halocaridina rubra TaxID=373956 RepID=A0AAN8X9H2_HALRR